MLNVNELIGFGVGDTAAPHRYWRFRTDATYYGSTLAVMSSMEMRATSGGADQCFGGGGSPSASHVQAGSSATNAFDNNGSTTWTSGIHASVGTPVWLKYAFPSPVHVGQLSLTPTVFGAGYGPASFKLQYSDDDSVWVDAGSWSGLTWPVVPATFEVSP